MNREEMLKEIEENYNRLPEEYQQFVDMFIEYLYFKQKKEEENMKAKQLSKGFNPSDDEWKRINAWEDSHTKERHKTYIQYSEKLAKGEIAVLQKMRPDAPHFEYAYETSPIGHLGAVTCIPCRDQAIKKCNGNIEKFYDLLKRNDVRYLF